MRVVETIRGYYSEAKQSKNNAKGSILQANPGEWKLKLGDNQKKFVSEDCPECCNPLTIFCIVPIEFESDIPISSESKNTLKRFCPKCEHVWPIK